MNDNFIYEMPGLSKYRFNHKGECIHLKKGTPIQVEYRDTGSGSIRLRTDAGEESRIQLKEVKAYINHLKQLQEFNPLVFHHYVTYRPFILRTRGRTTLY